VPLTDPDEAIVRVPARMLLPVLSDSAVDCRARIGRASRSVRERSAHPTLPELLHTLRGSRCVSCSPCPAGFTDQQTGPRPADGQGPSILKLPLQPDPGSEFIYSNPGCSRGERAGQLIAVGAANSDGDHCEPDTHPRQVA
jgi:hypothetical protein